MNSFSSYIYDWYIYTSDFIAIFINASYEEQNIFVCDCVF